MVMSSLLCTAVVRGEEKLRGGGQRAVYTVWRIPEMMLWWRRRFQEAATVAVDHSNRN